MIRNESHKLLARLVIWPVVVAVSSLLFFTCGPYVEAHLNPIITSDEPGDGVKNIARIDHHVCWEWTFDKLRNATPQYVSWGLLTPRSVNAIPIVVQSIPTDENPYGTTTFPIGRHTVKQCTTDFPPGIEAMTGIRIIGNVGYSSDHGLWVVWQRSVSFAVPDPIATPLLSNESP